MKTKFPSDTLYILAVVWLGHLVVDFFVAIWPMFKTLAQLELHLAGLILGISGFIGEGAQLFFGALSDRGWRHKLLFSGIVLAMAASFFAYTSSYFSLFFLMLLTYLGSAAFHPAGVATISRLTSTRKGFFVGIFASGGCIGVAISQLVYHKLFFVTSGQTAILAIPALTCTLFGISKKFKKTTLVQEASSQKINLFSRFKPLWDYRKELKPLYVSQVFQQATQSAFLFFLPDLLRLGGYGEWLCGGGGHFLLVLASALMLIPVGFLSDRFGQKNVILIALLLNFIFFYIVLLFPPSANWGMVLLLLSLGSCMGVVNPLGIALGNRILPQHASLVSALLMGGVWGLAHCLGAATAGLMTCCFTTDAIIHSLSILGVLLVFSFTLTLKLPSLQKVLNVE